MLRGRLAKRKFNVRATVGFDKYQFFGRAFIDAYELENGKSIKGRRFVFGSSINSMLKRNGIQQQYPAKKLGPVSIWGTGDLTENSSNTGRDPGCPIVHVSNIAYEIICQIVFTIISRFLSTHDWRFFFILCPTIPIRFST